MNRVWRRGASILWAQINRSVRFAWSHGWIKSTELPVKVISVGNIQAGGAGKTPLVAQIAREAHQQGLVVCILSRGYKGVWEKTGGVLTPGSNLGDPQLCGDEPALLHELCPFAWIGVGSDRVKQFGEVVKHLKKNPDLVLLDDGFQHWKIKKDLEIVAITGDQPQDRVFRESWDALRYADLVVWTKGKQLPFDLNDLPHLHFCQIAYEWVPFAQGKDTLDSPHQNYWLVTALADSKTAYDSAVKAGLTIVKHTHWADHFQFHEKEVKQLLAQAHDAGLRIILTGKDWVKWRALGVDASQVSVFEPQLKWIQGQEIWTQVLWEKS